MNRERVVDPSDPVTHREVHKAVNLEDDIWVILCVLKYVIKHLFLPEA